MSVFCKQQNFSHTLFSLPFPSLSLLLSLPLLLHLTGFDPWDVSTRGLAALLETEQKPPHPHPSSSSSSSSSAVNGVGQQRGRGGLSSAVTLDSSTNLSWQDELKSVFPNVNISFGGF